MELELGRGTVTYLQATRRLRHGPHLTRTIPEELQKRGNSSGTRLGTVATSHGPATRSETERLVHDRRVGHDCRSKACQRRCPMSALES